MDNFSNYREHRGFDWAAFLAGVLMIVAGLFLLRHPGKALHAFVLLFAILSIVQGFVWLVFYSHFHYYISLSWMSIVSGVLDILVGILFLYSYDAAGLTLAYLFAIWFLFDSISGIIVSWHMRNLSRFYFWFSLILNIFGLLIAISLMFNPALSALTLIWLISFWLLIFGVNEIVVAFARR
ncbi:DUF308 domain-containing protein [Lactobacillus sp. ESL0679]|uniref:HdeD family acid-resistance protein n=1 Tax=Lactobacillus sp. ESL0679 TaxID=2983209 RepID=UPI0023F73F0F|nr:DUF308 domain-containing protein [Lactobacillus sp. ESL0679]MDF7683719.1 DUF308 domain-containing protein [Lactobacillus sp. ESL0679]